MLSSSLRPLLFTSITRASKHRHTRLLSKRNFSLSRIVKASETTNSNAFVNAFRNTSICRKLADKPEALAALTNLAQLLQEAGLDLQSGKPPSAMQMMKLAMNPAIRESLKNVTAEMEKAGVDFKSQEVIDEIMNMRKSGGLDS